MTGKPPAGTPVAGGVVVTVALAVVVLVRPGDAVPACWAETTAAFADAAWAVACWATAAASAPVTWDWSDSSCPWVAVAWLRAAPGWPG